MARDHLAAWDSVAGLAGDDRPRPPGKVGPGARAAVRRAGDAEAVTAAPVSASLIIGLEQVDAGRGEADGAPLLRVRQADAASVATPSGWTRQSRTDSAGAHTALGAAAIPNMAPPGAPPLLAAIDGVRAESGWLSAGPAAPLAVLLAPETDTAAASTVTSINLATVASTQPHQVVFTSGAQGVFGFDGSFSFSLPSFLYQSHSFRLSTSFAGFSLSAGVSVVGGVKGSVNLGLGNYTPDYPVTIDPNVLPFVQDGQVFSIDPTLISTDDASFSLSLPQANANLDFGLQASAGATLSFPAIPIGVTLPFVGFVGYTVHLPSVSIGTTVGSIYKLPTNTTIKIPGDGTITLSELQAKTLTTAGTSAYGGLPTLELSGNTDPFFVANTDLIGILAQEVPDPFAVLQGSRSFAGGLASVDYKLLSMPLSGTLWLNEDVTLTPIGITETVTDQLTGETQTGTLGSIFNFTAPASGNGTIPLSITYGLELAVHTVLQLDGAIKLTIEGPQVGASVLGISQSFGPLGNFNVLDMSGKLFDLYSNTSTQTITETDVVSVQNFGSSVTRTVSAASAAINITQPASNLVVTAKGTITGTGFGVQTGTLSAAMVSDAGLISATGDGIRLQAGGSVDVQAGGRITARGSAPGTGVIMLRNPIESVTNAGAITGFTTGVNLLAGSVKNETGGTISATSVGITIASASASIVNNGAISAGTGILLSKGGSVYNALAGTISGSSYGIYAQAALTAENKCTLTGLVDGVRMTGGGTVTNLGGGFIYGGAIGVLGAGGSGVAVTNTAGGTITGKVGVSLSGTNTVLTNAGTIAGTLDAVQLYGTSANTLILDPIGQVTGGVRMAQSATNRIELLARAGSTGTLAGLGTVLPLSAVIAIDDTASWLVSGDFAGISLAGLNTSDVLNDTAIAFSPGEHVIFDAPLGALTIRQAGNASTIIGTIAVQDTPPIYGWTASAGTNGGVNIALPTLAATEVSANHGEVLFGGQGGFADTVTIDAGVTVTPNYYGDIQQGFGVLGAGLRGQLTNYGTILGNATAVELESGGIVTNAQGGTISGDVGVHLLSNSVDPHVQVALVNAGLITASAGGVYFDSAGTLTNNAGGTITTTGLNAAQFSAYGTVSNAGLLQGGSRAGVRMFAGGSVYNQASGTIAGRLGGVRISGAAGRVINCGTVTATSGAGVYLGAGGTLINETGSITGSAVGVLIQGAAGNVSNGASIGGILLSGGGTLVNGAHGTITAAAGYGGYGLNLGLATGGGGAGAAAYVHNMGTIAGVLGFAGDTLVNDGRIGGVGVTIGASTGSFALTNSGTITGAVNGVAAAASGSVVNAAGGVIGGPGSGGIGVSLGAGGSVTNAGTISGARYGVVLGGTATVLTNAGTIIGATAAAMLNGSASNTLILDAGEKLQGKVVAKSGASNSITLAAGAKPGTLTGFGTTVLNFGTVAFTGGAWVLGATTAAANATHFTGASASDTLVLAGNGAIGKSLSGFGVLQLNTGAFTLAAGAVPAVKTLAVQAGARLSGSGGIGALVTGAGSIGASAGAVLTLAGGFSFGGKLGGAGVTVLTHAGTLTAGAAITGRIVQQANVALGASETLTVGKIAYSLKTASASQTVQIVGSAGTGLNNTGALAAVGPGLARISPAVSNSGIISASGGTLTLLGAVSNIGTLAAAGGTLILAKQAQGTGALNVGTASTLWLQAGAAAGQSAHFLATTGTLELSQPSTFLGTIAGFAGSDVIDLANTAVDALTFGNGTLTASHAGTAVAHLALVGTYATSSFTLASDLHGGTEILFHG